MYVHLFVQALYVNLLTFHINLLNTTINKVFFRSLLHSILWHNIQFIVFLHFILLIRNIVIKLLVRSCFWINLNNCLFISLTKLCFLTILLSLPLVFSLYSTSLIAFLRYSSWKYFYFIASCYIWSWASLFICFSYSTRFLSYII
jgi:hypothetical protein